MLQENIDKEYTTRKNDTFYLWFTADVIHWVTFYKEFQELSEEYRSKFSTF